jgi:tetratricopeptide (TPR) repeat protein
LVTALNTTNRPTEREAQRLFDSLLLQRAHDPLALGLAALQVGRNDVAAEIFGKAIARNLAISKFHISLGIALRAQSRLGETAKAYRQALILQPNKAEAHNNLGNVFRAQGMRIEALNCYKQAMADRLEYAEAHFNAGILLDDLGDLTAAETELRLYWQYDPKDTLGATLLLARRGILDVPVRAGPAHLTDLYDRRS